MDRRLELQALLESIMTKIYPDKVPDTNASQKYHVYFQVDQNTRMAYPAIVYTVDALDHKRANNETYALTDRYQITVIDRNPDTKLRNEIIQIPYTRFLSRNVSDGLNHFVYATYF